MTDRRQIWVCDVCGESGTLRGKALKLLHQGQYVCPMCSAYSDDTDPEVTTRAMEPWETRTSLEAVNSALAATLIKTSGDIELDRLFREIAAAASRCREELIFRDLFSRLEKEYDRIEEEIVKDQQGYELRIARLKQELCDLAEAHDVAVNRLKDARSARKTLVDEVRQLDTVLSRALRVVAQRDMSLAKITKERDDLRDSEKYAALHLLRALELTPGKKDQWKMWTAQAQQIVERARPETLAIRYRLGASPEQRTERALAELKDQSSAAERESTMVRTTALGACPGCKRPIRQAEDMASECSHYKEGRCSSDVFGACCCCVCSDQEGGK
jgi:hypothetical protein